MFSSNSLLLYLGLGSTVAVAARSAVFQSQVGSDSGFGYGSAYDAGLFSPPVDSLSALSTEEFKVLKHPAFPRHSARIKKTDGFCDESVS